MDYGFVIIVRKCLVFVAVALHYSDIYRLRDFFPHYCNISRKFNSLCFFVVYTHKIWVALITTFTWKKDIYCWFVCERYWQVTRWLLVLLLESYLDLRSFEISSQIRDLRLHRLETGFSSLRHHMWSCLEKWIGKAPQIDFYHCRNCLWKFSAEQNNFHLHMCVWYGNSALIPTVFEFFFLQF